MIFHATEEDFQKDFSTIKNLYYRPSESGRVHIALKDGPHYKAIRHFLVLLDLRMEYIPNGLKHLKSLYNAVFGESDPTQELTQDLWEQLEKNASSGNKDARELAGNLVSWAEQYHLRDPQNMYVEIALRAIHYSWPESITDRVFLHQGLAGRAKDDIVDAFLKTHPFVFSPSWEALSKPLDGDESSRTFELEWNHQPERYERLPAYIKDPSWTGFSWDPRYETWTDFSRKMQRAFDKYKQSYMERMDTFMKEHGYVEIPKGLRKVKLDLHMKWFIDRHFLGKQYKEIADEYSNENEDGTTERNISNAVKEISDLIFLPLSS